jgi:hypothetical protein
MFDTKQEGLRTLFKPYQALLMEHIWDLNGARAEESHRGPGRAPLDLPRLRDRRLWRKYVHAFLF